MSNHMQPEQVKIEQLSFNTVEPFAEQAVQIIDKAEIAALI